MKGDIKPKLEKTKKQKIDILNEELYFKNKKFEQRKRRKIHNRNIELSRDFENNEKDFKEALNKSKKRKLPTSLFKKIFFFVLIFFLITVVVAVLSLYDKKDSVSNDLISMEVVGQPFVDGGEEFTLHIKIQNFNEQKLVLPDLILSYAKDSSRGEDEVFLRRSLPDIEKGKRVDEEFDLILYGKEGDIRNINATLEYRIEGSTSIFVKKASHSLIIRSTPIEISIDAPDEIIQNQEFEIKVNLSSNSNKQINNLLLDIEYPLGFEFISSNVEPDFGSNMWYIKNISEEDDDNNIFIIKGRLNALPGQGRSFYVKVGKQNISQLNSIETVFSKVTHTVEVQESFISIDFDVNNKKNSDITIQGGDDVDVSIIYKNNTEKKLSDVQVTARLMGDLYIPDKVLALRGEYNSNTNSVIWNKDNIDDFEQLNPGESGSLSLNLKTKDLVSLNGVIKNPKFSILIDVSGIGSNGEIKKALNVANINIMANSDINVIAKTSYSDGPFLNSGPIPPRAGRETTYTITLQVTNSSNILDNAKITTTLPPYVRWMNNIAPSKEKRNVSYNNTTQEVVWDIGTINDGVGIGNTPPKQVSFKVSLLPSLSHVGIIPDITRDIILSGTDTFTNVNLSLKKIPLTTKLSDPSSKSQDAVVSS